MRGKRTGTNINIKDKEVRDDVNENKYELNNGFSEDWSQNCGLTLAREDVPDSNGVVLTSTKTRPLALYNFDYPEKVMMNRAKNYFAQARMVLSVVVKANGAPLSPFKKYVMQSGGRPWILLAQTIDWNTDECTAEFFEPSYNT